MIFIYTASGNAKLTVVTGLKGLGQVFYGEGWLCPAASATKQAQPELEGCTPTAPHRKSEQGSYGRFARCRPQANPSFKG